MEWIHFRSSLGRPVAMKSSRKWSGMQSAANLVLLGESERRVRMATNIDGSTEIDRTRLYPSADSTINPSSVDDDPLANLT